MEGLRILREVKLLGKDRKFGDLISQEDAEKIPGPSLRALVDLRDVELLGEAPHSRMEILEEKVDHLIARVDVLSDEHKPKPKAKIKRKTSGS